MGFENKIGEAPKELRFSWRRDYHQLYEHDFYRLRPEKFLFLVGFPKTATSSISAALDTHHSIALAKRKEPFFFATDEYDYGLGFYWEKYFSPLAQCSVAVDANTANSFLPYSPKRIRESIPDAKIVFAVRDPVKRAFSNWRMYVSSGEENLSFKEAVAWELREFRKGLIPLDNEEFWKWYMRRLVTRDLYLRRKTVRTYLTRGLYAHHIARYIRQFGKGQVMVVFQEDLQRNKQNVLDEIFDFLGLHPIDVSTQHDYHVSPSNASFTRSLKRILPKSTLSLVPRSVKQSLSATLDAVVPQDTVPHSVEDQIRKFYQTADEELEEILQRPLPW